MAGARGTRPILSLSYREGLVVGSFQIAALFAGISRSGVAIVGGLVRGLSHEDAAQFSFLLATPVIFAAGVLKLPSLAGPAAAHIHGQILVGMAVAFAAAYLSTRFLVRYFETRTLTPVALYSLVIGVACIARFAWSAQQGPEPDLPTRAADKLPCNEEEASCGERVPHAPGRAITPAAPSPNARTLQEHPMSHPRTSARLAGRVATVSAAFVLAMGATGALGVAFADDNPPTPATSGSPATGTTEDGNAYILSTDGSGTFNLALTVPGTSIAIDYTVDTTGAVTAASTSTAGATVTVDGHDLTVTLADGRTVQVELGDKGDTVDEVETDTADSSSGDRNGDGSDDSETPEPTNAPDSHNADDQGDNNDQGASSNSPYSGETDAPEATHSSEPNHSSDSSGSGSSDGGSSYGSGSGSDN